jgi:hypothetical protein
LVRLVGVEHDGSPSFTYFLPAEFNGEEEMSG